jgi:hypothetical protein
MRCWCGECENWAARQNHHLTVAPDTRRHVVDSCRSRCEPKELITVTSRRGGTLVDGNGEGTHRYGLPPLDQSGEKTSGASLIPSAAFGRRHWWIWRRTSCGV